MNVNANNFGQVFTGNDTIGIFSNVMQIYNFDMELRAALMYLLEVFGG